MAKKKSTRRPTPKPTTIPASLEKHIQDQQNIMHTAQSLLGCIIKAVDDEPSSEGVDNVSLSLKHLDWLLGQVNESLDSVNVKRAMTAVQS
jgi:hypothetical protein